MSISAALKPKEEGVPGGGTMLKRREGTARRAEYTLVVTVTMPIWVFSGHSALLVSWASVHFGVALGLTISPGAVRPRCPWGRRRR